MSNEVARQARRIGLVLAAYGRQFLVQEQGLEKSLPAVSKGRNADIAVGDRVVLGDAGKDKLVISRVLARKNQLRRSTDRRSKVLAANIDQTALVLAPEPAFSEAVVLRVGIEAIAAEIPLIIIANKSDAPAFSRIEPRLDVFEQVGIDVIRISAKINPDKTRKALTHVLQDRTTLLLGESGMGKSTLLNVLVPDAEQRTGEYSKALQSGRHTTTFSRLFVLDGAISPDARVIDSPGFQQFGIAHLSETEREHGVPEFRQFLGQCRFNNCSHRTEPGCAIREAVHAKIIDPIRYKIFCDLTRDS